MKIVLDFLNQLAENNNKEWFDANKSFYKEVKQTFEAFTEKLIINISEFDPTIRNLTVKDCTYRIYRDLRFSKTKLHTRLISVHISVQMVKSQD